MPQTTAVRKSATRSQSKPGPHELGRIILAKECLMAGLPNWDAIFFGVHCSR